MSKSRYTDAFFKWVLIALIVLQTVVSPLATVSAEGVDENLVENLQHQDSVDKEKDTKTKEENTTTDEVEQLNKETKPSKSDSSNDGVVDKSKEETQQKEEVKPKEPSKPKESTKTEETKKENKSEVKVSKETPNEDVKKEDKKDVKKEEPKKEVKQTKVEKMTSKMVENIVEESSQRKSEDDTSIIPDAKVIIGDDGLHYYDGIPILIKDSEKPMGDEFREMIKSTLKSYEPKPKSIAQYESLAEVETEDLIAYLPKVFMDTYTTVSRFELVPTIYAAQDNRIYNEGDATFQGVHAKRWGNYFSFNDFLAFCIQRDLTSPQNGSSITSHGAFTAFKKFQDSETNRNRFFKAYYYGYGGPASVFGETHNGKISDVKKHMSSNKQKASEGVILTSEVLSYVYQGKGSTQLANLMVEPNFKKLYDIVFDDTIKVSRNNRFVRTTDTTQAIGESSKLSITRKNGKQVTETVMFDSYPKNTVSIPVPSGVTLVNNSTGKSTKGGNSVTASVSGGNKFHFEADNSFSLNYKTGALKSNNKVLQPYIIATKNTGLQDLGILKSIDPVKNMHLNADFKPNTATVTIGHTDTSKKTSNGKNTIIEQKKETVTIGTTKTYCPKTNSSFTNGEKGVTYKPLTGCKTVTVTGNTTVWLDYTTEWKLTVHLVDYHDNARVIKTTQNNVSKNYNSEVKFNYSASGDANNNFLVDRTKEREGRKVRYNYYGGGVDKTVNSKKMESGNQNFKMPRGNKTIYIPYQPRRNVTVIHKDMDEGKGVGLLDPEPHIRERYENHPSVFKIDRAHIDKPVYVDGKTGKQYVYQGHKKDYKGSILPSNTAEFQPKKDDHVVEFLFRQQTGVEVIHKDLYTTTLLKPTQTTTGVRTSKKDFKAEKEITKDGKTYVYHGYKINKKGSILPESTYSHTYGTEGVTIEFLYKLKRTVTVNYLDFFTNKAVQPSLVETYLQKDKYSYSPIKTIVQNGTKAVYHFFKATGDPQEGVVETSNINIDYNYKKEINVVVEYKDKRNNKDLLKKKEYKVLQGDSISEVPRDIPHGIQELYPNRNYRYVDTTMTGVSNYTGVKAGANDIHIIHYYDMPLAKVELDKIEVYTAPLEDGLPVRTKLKIKNMYETSIPDMKDPSKKITVGLYRGSEKITSKTLAVKDLNTNFIEFKIPTNKIVASKSSDDYTVKLEGYKTEDFYVTDIGKQVTTKGYLSKQTNVSYNGKTTPTKTYEYPVMTEKYTDNNQMNTYYEYITFEYKALGKQKSGYGVEANIEMHYENELGSNYNYAVNVDKLNKIDFNAPKALKEDQTDYQVSNGKLNLELKGRTQSSNTQIDLYSQSNKWVFPTAYVSKGEGKVYTDKQYQDNAVNRNTLVDGGNQFFIPVWADKQVYNVDFQTNEVGVNLVTYTIKDSIDVYAQMMVTMDSDTKDKDGIVFVPINAERPFASGKPKNFTTQDVEWLKY